MRRVQGRESYIRTRGAPDSIGWEIGANDAEYSGQEAGYCQERPDGISSAVPILDSSEYKTVSAGAVSPFALSFALHRRKHSRRGFRRRPHSLYPLSLFCTPPNRPKPTLLLFRKSFAMFGYATALILAAAAPSALATVYVSPPNSLHSTLRLC